MKSLIVLFLFGAIDCLRAVTVTDVQVVEFGTFHKTASGGLMLAPNSITGMAHAVSEATLIEKTSRIHASIGTSFGMRIKVIGEPGGAIVNFTGRCVHPKFTDPVSGQSSTVEEWSSHPMIGHAGYIGYTFDNSWELVPGKWTIQVFYGATLVARKEFDVTVTAHAPNHAMEPTASRRTTQLHMSSTLQSGATPAPARGSSSCSR